MIPKYLLGLICKFLKFLWSLDVDNRNFLLLRHFITLCLQQFDHSFFPDEMRSEYLTGVDQVAIENFTVEVPIGWEPVLNEEHDYYRWLSRDDAVAIAHWPETKEVLAEIAESMA